MLESQRLSLRSSEIRQRLNELGGVSDWTDEQREESERLTTEFRDVEARYRAALVTESEEREDGGGDGDGDGEGRELDELRQAFDVGRLMHAVVEHREVDGPERELQQAANVQPNALPLAVLGWTDPGGAVEERATAAPDNVGQPLQPLIPYVWPMAAHTYLGIPTPRVAAGEPVYPVLTNPGGAANTPGEGAAGAELDATFGAEKLSPQRIQAAYEWSREDAATFPIIGSALRDALREGLMDKFDAYILTDDAVGLFDDQGLALTAGTANGGAAPDAIPTWANIASDLAGRVDGRYAADESGIRVRSTRSGASAPRCASRRTCPARRPPSSPRSTRGRSTAATRWPRCGTA